MGFGTLAPLMRWRPILLLALVAAEGATATASEPPLAEAPAVEIVTAPEVRVIHVPPLESLTPATSSMSSAFDEALREIEWTVSTSSTVSNLGFSWGMTVDRLVRLNPTLEGAEHVQAGTRLVVYRDDPEEPTRSIGRPNHGKLSNGMPLPEGESWRLRDRRVRDYGTRLTVRSLVQAFARYGRLHPDGPKIHVGEISTRKGGRVFPHKSHRTGRDVDIGYILKPGVLGEHYWRRATPEMLDVERTWTLIESIVQSGDVQKIFVSSRLQKPLREHAKARLSQAEFGKYFRIPGGGSGQRYLISHENGHRDHFHVRFGCESGDRRCRGS